MHTEKKPREASGLILLCWLVYTCTYVGKLSYNANLSRIGEAFGVSYADAGLVSTCFFFAYGAGQVVNGLLCKRYNIKYVILTCLTVSSLINLCVGFIGDFSVFKYLWLLNGFSMSFLWTLLIRLLSETIAKKDLPRAIFAMGTTVAIGTSLVYGLSALFATALSWRTVFFVAAAILLFAATVWLIRFDRLVVPLRRKREREEKLIEASGEARETGVRSILVMLCVLVLFAFSNNFVKDGLTAWTPDILSSLYATPAWLSILLTLLLPAVAVGGTAVAVRLFGKTGSFVGTCVILFSCATLLIGAVIGFLQTPLLPATVTCLAMVSCLMAGVNNVITSMAPLHLKSHVPSGKLAGILNGFCYLGSTVSTYSLGAVADAWSWMAVFILLLSVSVFVVSVGGGYLVIAHLRRKGCKGL